MFAELQEPPQRVFERPLSTPTKDAPANPASMRLQAVRERGHVVDFTWESAGSAAAYLLHCDPLALRGQSLLRNEVIAGPLGHPALIDRYRRVLEHGNAQSFEQVHLVDGQQDVVIHRVVPEGDGVTVTLTNQSAERRAQVLRLQLGVLRACMHRRA